MMAYVTRSWQTVLPLALVSVLTIMLARGVTIPADLASGSLATWLHGQPSGLPRIGPAPAFKLITQEGQALALDELRGKVVLLTFIYTSCTDTCPLLTGKLAGVRHDLGPADGADIHFVSVTVDPAHDTPDVLRAYAERFRADPAGWSFLTGTPADISAVTGGYGVFVRHTARGDVDHTFLTSLIDRHGTLRVQYLGTRFNPVELVTDVRALVRER